VPRPKRTTGPVDQFRGIRGLCALLWYEYFSQVFLHPRKWLAKRRRRSHDTRQEMFIWGSGIVVFLGALLFVDLGYGQEIITITFFVF
jgi:energy-converting hydrogenase Eha subunit G